jgi:hypothetical protein
VLLISFSRGASSGRDSSIVGQKHGKSTYVVLGKPRNGQSERSFRSEA